MKTVLFLGAGASAFAGCPTTKKLRELTLGNIRKRLDDHIDGFESNRLKFLEHIIQNTQLDDIEKVYSCVDYILDAPKRYGDAVLSEMPHTGSGVGMNLPNVLDALRMLRRIIYETMLSNFAVDGGQKDIEKMYGSLVDVVGGASGSVDIITTNYDNIIETYCNRTDTRLVDGLEPSRNGDHRVWKDSWNMEDDNCVRLVKLHGSVTWQRRDGEIIGMMVPGSRREGEDVLVEPTLDTKDYGDKPFPQLFKQCDGMLAGTGMLVAIGYSFRDDAINRKIMGAISHGMQMLVVSPSAESDVQENLKPDAKYTKGIRSKIETMPEEFGRDGIAGLCERVKAILDGG